MPLLLQGLFGLHGAFAYLASALYGLALGVGLEAEAGRPSRRFIGTFSACVALMFVAGAALLRYQLQEAPEEERTTFRRAAAHNRLFFGAADTAIILVLLGTLECSPRSRAAWERATRRYRRLAQMSFSAYAVHEPLHKLLWLAVLRGILLRLPPWAVDSPDQTASGARFTCVGDACGYLPRSFRTRAPSASESAAAWCWCCRHCAAPPSPLAGTCAPS